MHSEEAPMGDEASTPVGEKGYDDDVVVVKKSTVLTIGVALIAFIVGGLVGYLAALAYFKNNLATAQDQAVARTQPTALPERLDNVSVDDDPFRGPEDAPVTIVEFGDFRCGYCKRFNDQTIEALFEQYGDQIRLVYRDFPVVGGEQAAEAAECADEQGAFWDYHDGLYAEPQAFLTIDSFVTLAKRLDLDEEQFRACIEAGTYRDEIIADYNDGRAYGVTGTPTFFINGVRIIGAQPLAVFQAVIDKELGR